MRLLSIPPGFLNFPDKARPHPTVFKYTTGHGKNPASVLKCNCAIIVGAFGSDAMSCQSQLKLLISHDEIAKAVARLASEINRDYQGKTPLLIGILKGSFVFMADLIRQLDLPLELDFVKLSSYGSARESSGKVRVVQGLKTPIRGRDVLVVEDIVDTGITTFFLLDYLKKKKPASLKLCALTDKPSRHRVPVSIDYLGFTVPDKFIVGYGIDCDEKYRNLPDIYAMED
jgi:hypoxanthine phosphoribosyltransferase